MKNLVDVYFPDAWKIKVILDNLNTHTFSALYEVFSPEEASRIMRRLEFHYTPKHGSWLNQIELEFSVLSRQCLNRRIGDIEELRSEIEAWEKARNQKRIKIDWRFKVDDAREKMGCLYPNINLS